VTRWTLHARSLVYHWPAHLAVVLGVVAASAALTGALLVGDSMRQSLRDAALERLGRVTHAIQSPRFVRQTLVSDLAGDGVDAAGVIRLRGAATHAATAARVSDVQILGVAPSFLTLDAGPGGWLPDDWSGRIVALSEPLADGLGAAVGDAVLLRLPAARDISSETLLGRRDERARTVRLRVAKIVPAAGLAAFDLRPQQRAARNAFVPRATLARVLDQRDAVNTLLLVAGDEVSAYDLAQRVDDAVSLHDVGLRLRTAPEHGYVALESDALLLSPAAEALAASVPATLAPRRQHALAQLANEIRIADTERSVPYSTVVAIDGPLWSAATTTAPAPQTRDSAPPIVLNQWTADALAASVGDVVELTCYELESLGKLTTAATTFRVQSIVPLSGWADDPGFAPRYPGVTDAERIGDWDPPFPIDLSQITDRDETYWDTYRATPKAFVPLDVGQRLWAQHPQRFGRLTSIRFFGDGAAPPARDPLATALRRGLDPAAFGLHIDAVRDRARAASTGTTDFAGLFIGFSFFLIAAAAMLVTLLFRLAVERRAPEIGLLLAVGFTPGRVRAALVVEGTLLAIVGSGVGLLVARGYTRLILLGLRTWWADAANTPFLTLHATAQSCAIGFATSVAIAILAIIVALRGLTRLPAQALLRGETTVPRPVESTHTWPRILAMAVFVLIAIGGLVAPALGKAPATLAFFVGGTALLVAWLVGFGLWLRGSPANAKHPTGPAAILRLAARNARRNPGRSLLTTGLIAAATFVITALQAMRLTLDVSPAERDGPTGGYTLLAEAAVPLGYDLNTPAGRAALGIADANAAVFSDATFMPARVRPGDDASCLSLYRPLAPRIVGVTDAFIDRGGFRFAAVDAEDAPANSWALLREHLDDDAVPAIADEAAAKWQLKRGLGDDIDITAADGSTAQLRLVGLLRGSVLQGELLIAEPQFTRLYPNVDGYGLLLIDAPLAPTDALARRLERELADHGVAVTSTMDRLRALFQVQNTYLSTFQSLGGLGLLLGAVGLAAVTLRNVWQRRAELALLRAVGFDRVRIALLVLAENALLVLAGLVAGVTSAAIVATPHIMQRGVAMPWGSLLAMFALVLIAGVAGGAVALRGALATPLVPALRNE
jgi:putative ABC transport system permease protein